MGNSTLTSAASSTEASGNPEIAALPGFQSGYLPGICVSPDVLAKETEILAPLCLRGHFPQAAGASRPSSSFRNFPQLLKVACVKHHVTLLDLQSLILPPWGLHWGSAFPSKAEMFAFARRKTSPDCLGELTDLELSGQYLNIQDDGLTMRTGRWAVLLDGITVVKLISGRSPAKVRTWADTRTISAALESLRKVCWSPELDWAFPSEYRKRMLFLRCLGKRLKLSPVWERVVFPFFAYTSLDEMSAASWGMARPGQYLAYYSTTSARWMPCRILATDPAQGSAMLDIKPGYWIAVAELARCTRMLV